MFWSWGGLGGLALVDLNRISDVQIPPRYTTVISTSWRTGEYLSWRIGEYLSGEPENISVGEPENISVGEPENISVGER